MMRFELNDMLKGYKEAGKGAKSTSQQKEFQRKNGNGEETCPAARP
jgi:hypothetical protein